MTDEQKPGAIEWETPEGRVRLYVGFVDKGPEAAANAQDLRLAGYVPVGKEQAATPGDGGAERVSHEKARVLLTFLYEATHLTSPRENLRHLTLLNLYIDQQETESKVLQVLRAELTEAQSDACRMHYLGNLIRQRDSAEQAELNALMRKYPPRVAAKTVSDATGAMGSAWKELARVNGRAFLDAHTELTEAQALLVKTETERAELERWRNEVIASAGLAPHPQHPPAEASDWNGCKATDLCGCGHRVWAHSRTGRFRCNTCGCGALRDVHAPGPDPAPATSEVERLTWRQQLSRELRAASLEPHGPALDRVIDAVITLADELERRARAKP
jgi:hypothetical protein